MQDRRILIIGGCGLAFGAAFANAGFILLTGTSVSHLTGDISKLALDLASLDPGMLSLASRVAVAAISFLIGATVCGFLVHHPTLDFSRPYGRTITSIGLLFLGSSLLVGRSTLLSIALAAGACGLQNSLATHYRGIILRTTHVTGLITDLGVFLGMRIRGHDVPRWKIGVPALLVLCFFLGVFCAAVIHFRSSIHVISIAGLCYCFAGLGWSILKRSAFASRIAERPNR